MSVMLQKLNLGPARNSVQGHSEFSCKKLTFFFLKSQWIKLSYIYENKSFSYSATNNLFIAIKTESLNLSEIAWLNTKTLF